MDDELARKRRRRADRTPPIEPPVPEDELARHDRAATTDDATAEGRDDAAKAEDRDAAERDRAAERRDVDAEAEMASVPLPAVRRRARRDREQAARDRTSSVDDRGRARRNRRAARRDRDRASSDRGAAADAVALLRELLNRAEDNAEDMLLIGQAQGQLMETRQISGAEALLEVFARAARDGTELGSAARRIVADGPE